MLRGASSVLRRASPRYRTARRSTPSVVLTRSLADKTSIKNATPPVLPGSQSRTTVVPAPPPPGPVVAAPAANPTEPVVPMSTPPLQAKLPPPPASATISGSPPPKRKSGRFRRFLLYLILLSAAGYGGSVWYAMRSDNFHDFFTEYVPFGEDAVLYFEEREFRKRFPRALATSARPHEDRKITIPSKSGMSSRVRDAESGGISIDQKGPHMSAVDQHASTTSPSAAVTSSSSATPTKDPQLSKTSASTDRPAKSTSGKDGLAAATDKTSSSGKSATLPPSSAAAATTHQLGDTKKMPEVNEPSVYIPVSRIDPLNIQHADEPVVQDLVKVLNDIILVINADKSSAKMASSVEKAKSELTKVGQKIINMKQGVQTAAEAKTSASEAEFENAARELVRRLESELREQESKWREEFEAERLKISSAYDERLATEIKKVNETSDQLSQNRLLEQAISLKKDFTSDVKQIVETERNGRLSKLTELSSSVEELEGLAAAWNAVIDTNLQTQHLQVAVEAVRANVERSGGRPFIKELAALKEIAADDTVVSSAIASINPLSYQRGIPTSAQLIDRFRSVADEVRKASLLPEDAGVASHAASYLVSRVLFKKQGRAVGDDVESVLTRTETLLEEGNLDEAAREMNSLTGWAKTLSTDWLGEIRRVLEVRQALDIISTEARLQSLKVD